MDPPADFKDRLKASYDAMAPEYNAWTERHTYLRLKYRDELCARAPKLTEQAEARVLELGCGAGNFLEALFSKAGPNVTAAANDLSDTQLDMARRALEKYEGRISYQAGDMGALTFPDGSLTAVVALYSLIHLTSPEQADMLSKIARWLEPGGVLISTFAIEEGSDTMDGWLHEKGWMYWSSLGADGTKKKLAEVGLNIESAVIEGDDEEKFLWIIARK
jgi:ubiquinone/menaquinone biosynthesis C-methylase UbiE